VIVPELPGALCAQTDPEIFFPKPGGKSDLAKRLCMRCPERSQCAFWAMSRPERYGVWGGLSEADRGYAV